MKFEYPELFWLLLPLVLLGVWSLKRFTLQRRDTLFVLLGMGLLLISLSQPYTEAKMQEEEAYGLDVVLAVDVSHSMSATDISPSRFEAAKRMLRELVESGGTNRYAVLAFTSNALPLTPLTSDREILAQVMDSLELENILTKSTDIMAVLKKSAKILKSRTKPVVIFSDGGDKHDFSAEIAFARQNGIRLFFVPVATASGAKLYDRYGEVVLDSAKRLVISHRNRYVAQLSEATGGLYLETFDAGGLLDELEKVDDELTRQTLQTMTRSPLFLPFVLGAFVLFMLTTIRLKKRSPAAALLLLLVLPDTPLHAGALGFWYEYQARSGYEAGDYEKAAHYYELLAGENEAYAVAYNLANSYYKLGRFDEAIILYEAIKSSDPLFKSDVYYNIGNAQARKEEYKKAGESYLKSLVLRYARDADTNRQIVKRAKKGYNPDAMKKKGEGPKDKGLQPKQEGKKKGKNKEEPKDNLASKKLDLSDKEKQVIRKAAKKKPLSYKQYEMINERAGSNEKNPW